MNRDCRRYQRRQRSYHRYAKENMFRECRLPGERDHFRAGFAMSMGPPVCH